MTWHEKTGPKYTYSYYTMYHSPLPFKILEIYKLHLIAYINDVIFIRLLMKLFYFEIRKCGQFYVYISPIFSCRVTFVICIPYELVYRNCVIALCGGSY